MDLWVVFLILHKLQFITHSLCIRLQSEGYKVDLLDASVSIRESTSPHMEFYTTARMVQFLLCLDYVRCQCMEMRLRTVTRVAS